MRIISGVMNRSAIVLCLFFLLIAQNALAGAQREKTAVRDGEVVELRIMTRMTTGEVEPNNAVLNALQDRLNLRLNWELKPAADYRRQFNVMVASGDWPDAAEAQFADPLREIRELAEDGVFMALDDLLFTYGHNVLRARGVDPETGEESRPGLMYRPLPDGKVYSLPTRGNVLGIEEGVIVRLDWLENVGMRIPTNLDELHEVAHALTFGDPNRSGRNDTYGIADGFPAESRNDIFRLIVMPAHGVVHGQWEEVDGELVWWAVRPEYREAVKYFRTLFQEGLVDPEFPITPRATWLDNLYEGTYGMHFWWLSHLDPKYSVWWGSYTAGQSDAKIGWIGPFADPYGRKRFPAPGDLAFHGFSSHIFSSSKHPEAVMKLMDYVATPEGAALVDYGVEGQHWRRRPDGQPEFFDLSSEELRQAGTRVYKYLFNPSQIHIMNDVVQDAADTIVPYLARPIFEQRVPAQDQFGAGLRDLENSTLLRWTVQPGVNVDAEWDAFVREWYEKGGREFTDQINAAYYARR